MIGKVLTDDVPADVDERLHAQLEQLRFRLGERDKPGVRRPTAFGRRLWVGVSAAAAVALAAVLMAWSLLPRESFAAVAAAVLSRPWIHVQTTDPRGATNEFWYSPVKDVSAWHDSQWIEYRDHRLRIYYAYDLHDKVLYRVPEEMPRSMEPFAAMIQALRVLLESKQPVDNPLERLGFASNRRDRCEVVKQQIEQVKEGDHPWLDYHVTVLAHDDKLPQPTQSEMLFRVDPTTKLLRLVRYGYDGQGKHTTVEQRFDYPERGPADVYDLGVPKTVRLVDRVPGNDLARMLEALRAGRQRMDDYRAIIVPREDGSWHPAGFPNVVYRKGDKFRRDEAIWIDLNKMLSDRRIPWPKGGKDAGDWWRKRIQDDCFLSTSYIDCGPISYHVKTRWVTDADGSHHEEVVAVEKGNQKTLPGEIYPALWSWMPEFACRPPLGIPHETLEAVIEPHPEEGPPGTILLRVRHVGPKLPRQQTSEGKPLPPPPDAWRYWLDPQRDYAVVRGDMIGNFDETGKRNVMSEINEEMARSPQGTWYVTRIRRKGSIRTHDGKTHDQIIDLYVDFTAALPDSLFEPPVPGQRVH